MIIMKRQIKSILTNIINIERDFMRLIGTQRRVMSIILRLMYKELGYNARK